VGDLAPRPRGGWQFGTRLSRGRLSEERSAVDLAPDVYSVVRLRAGAFEVRHFPSNVEQRPCCIARVTCRAGESELDALARASRLCDQQHEAKR